MMKFASVAILAASLSGACVVAAQAAGQPGLDSRIQWAQLNSPGDGLDQDAASQGNGRPSRRAAPPRKKSSKRVR